MKLLSDRTIETKSKYDYLNLFFFLINGKIRAFLSLNAQVLSAIAAMAMRIFPLLLGRNYNLCKLLNISKGLV